MMLTLRADISSTVASVCFEDGKKALLDPWYANDLSMNAIKLVRIFYITVSQQFYSKMFINRPDIGKYLITRLFLVAILLL